VGRNCPRVLCGALEDAKNEDAVLNDKTASMFLSEFERSFEFEE
jgi:hypothetical protein